MKNIFFFLWVIFILKLSSCFENLKRIWLLRHCDKPLEYTNPCCNKIGEERTFGWIHYFIPIFTEKNKIEFYTSNFNNNNNEKHCVLENINYYSNDRCKSSQRMFFTSYHIQYSFMNVCNKNINNKNCKEHNDRWIINPKINNNFCTGESKLLMNTIMKNNHDNTDIFIIWEHKEMIDIIRYFGIKIDKWRRKYGKHYDIIFMIDVPNKKLYYDCYNYSTIVIKCLPEIEEWLKPFGRIYTDYFKETDYFTPLKN